MGHTSELIPMPVRHLLHHIGLSDAPWTHGYSKQCMYVCFVTSYPTVYPITLSHARSNRLIVYIKIQAIKVCRFNFIYKILHEYQSHQSLSNSSDPYSSHAGKPYTRTARHTAYAYPAYAYAQLYGTVHMRMSKLLVWDGTYTYISL